MIKTPLTDTITFAEKTIDSVDTLVNKNIVDFKSPACIHYFLLSDYDITDLIPKYPNDEFNYIEIPFWTFFNPTILFTLPSLKPLKIHNRNWPRTNVNTPSNKSNLFHTQVTLPKILSSNIGNILNKLSIKTVTLFS